MPHMKEARILVPDDSDCYSCPECYVEVVFTNLGKCEKCKKECKGRWRTKEPIKLPDTPPIKSTFVLISKTGKRGQQTFES